MKKFRIIRDYLSFNRSELRGVIVLLILLLMVASVNQLLPEEHVIPSVNFPGLEKELMEFEAGIRRAGIEDSLKRGSKYKTFWSSAERIKDTVKSARYQKPTFSVDVNKADTLEFQRLKGIGPSFARRIVTYRNKLGGFISCRQLLEVWGVDTSLYNLIREQLVISSDSVRKLDINTVSFKELLRHPYFPYELTRSLILYRQKNKIFRSVDELNSVEGINDSIFRRIKPYVRAR
ncbi:MAG: helix-hairpin-helix domain-containing protein [Bacteroidetes bacterium]|nr:helix-hairpin-helix domain-containing protein [Bacteroidota bacterium]